MVPASVPQFSTSPELDLLSLRPNHRQRRLRRYDSRLPRRSFPIMLKPLKWPASLSA